MERERERERGWPRERWGRCLLVLVSRGVSKLDLDDGRGVDGATVALLHATDLCAVGLLADGEDIFRSKEGQHQDRHQGHQGRGV